MEGRDRDVQRLMRAYEGGGVGEVIAGMEGRWVGCGGVGLYALVLLGG